MSSGQSALEQQESEMNSTYEAKCSELRDDIGELEKIISSGVHNRSLCKDFDDSLQSSVKRLHSAKTELAVKLREIVSLKRQLDSVPSQGDLIQYERRFSELYIHIQDKLRQTRIYYATFNALLEIKELMLKETSLLNSISSQFQDAITSTGGGKKLVDSMEGIVKGTQQKLEKVEIVLQAEQKACDSLKQRCVAVFAEQRRRYSLLKAFQKPPRVLDKVGVVLESSTIIHPWLGPTMLPLHLPGFGMLRLQSRGCFCHLGPG